ncbi:ureidoglycolate dehydrogenase [Paenibacillus eucommiae]|uniref:Ureidoglycolate dehydrogenase (NAD+) n=1 Tax=Paenibacillus eucommiae TaxID=1355755 RepID=A0ABS4J1K8_9BACL|nr:ureidoglycolate dehydrogenase [Paenibacillus eucommiae]MBP1993702.1 ureidoglycolate dehydrogenase (NAD+) [Paenibacillus eucommiae]
MTELNRENIREEKLLSPQQLTELCVNKLTKAGIAHEHARITADVLVHANLRGVDSHGVLRMEHYIQKITHGGINANPQITVHPTGPVTATVDGDDGLGHIIAEKAMSHAIELARASGIGMVGATNSSHCGALSYFAEMAARQNMIGMVMTNTDKMVVPFGGSQAFFGTNPMAFGFPSGTKPPIIVDMATSSVAYGKILESLQAGKSIPADWAVDAEGKPVTDPHQFSALLPFGGAKGYALGLVVDIFAGILTGSPYGPHVSQMYGGDYTDRRKLGHFFCAIDVSRFTGRDSFLANIDQMMDELHTVPPAPGNKGVMLPGEPEYLRACDRQDKGIPIPLELFQYLNEPEGLVID